MGLRVARGRRLLALGTDTHLSTPGRRLQQGRGCIEALLAEMAHEAPRWGRLSRGTLLDECQLLVRAMGDDDWAELVARARPLAASPARK